MDTLPAFIRRHRALILATWRERARALPPANHLPRDLLDDHIPRILDRLAEATERGDTSPAPLADTPAEHAAQRFHEGYDLRQIVGEYRLLRQVVVELYAEGGDLSDASRPNLMPLTVMNEALDRAIADAVDHHALQTGSERERFIAILGHDLRDPLNSIAFGVESLRLRLATHDDSAQRLASSVSRSAKRMAAMIADMLDFARGHLGGGLPIVAAPGDARDIVARVVEEVALAHPEREIQSGVRQARGAFDVRWDANRVAQAVANLLTNALTHGADPVVVELQDGDSQVGISVSNRGDVAAAHTSRLFQPFVSGSTRSQGLGLGLYIVKEIAQAHGGTVDVQSGGGTTSFRVLLPRSTESES